jgi:uncharacterized protein
VQATLDRLVERGYVARHERRPGQKELRYEQLLGGFGAGVAAAAEAGDPVAEGDAGAADAGAEPGAEAAGDAGLVPAEDRLTRLEREVATLRSELASLREALGD